MKWTDELDDAFMRGVEVGRREGSVFRGVPDRFPWTTGAKFRFRRSWFDSFADYERDLVSALRETQASEWWERKRMAAADPPASTRHPHGRAFILNLGARNRRHRAPTEAEVAESRLAAIGAVRTQIRSELSLAREAVDAELATGRGRPSVVKAMRLPPRQPTSVQEYSDVDKFVSEDRRRALPDWPHRRDAGGMDFGHNWGLENAVRRWERTRWRISWLSEGFEDGTREVYAIEFHDDPPGERRTGRVWLLGTIETRDGIDDALGELELSAMTERNSLVAAAEAVAQHAC